MTPEELIAACREAWPETGASRWEGESYRSKPAVHQAERSVGPYYVLLAVGGYVLKEQQVRGRVYDGDGEHRTESVGPLSIEGVREVVTALRAWCREEARRLAEEVDPGAADL